MKDLLLNNSSLQSSKIVTWWIKACIPLGAVWSNIIGTMAPKMKILHLNLWSRGQSHCFHFKSDLFWFTKSFSLFSMLIIPVPLSLRASLEMYLLLFFRSLLRILPANNYVYWYSTRMKIAIKNENVPSPGFPNRQLLLYLFDLDKSNLIIKEIFSGKKCSLNIFLLNGKEKRDFSIHLSFEFQVWYLGDLSRYQGILLNSFLFSR